MFFIQQNFFLFFLFNRIFKALLTPCFFFSLSDMLESRVSTSSQYNQKVLRRYTQNISEFL